MRFLTVGVRQYERECLDGYDDAVSIVLIEWAALLSLHSVS